ncbi:MAG: ADP-ribosylation family protein [Gemmataceae bacterium]
MSLLSQRLVRLQAEYGFVFPADLLDVWQFACRLRPLEPLAAFAHPLGIHLVGPFEVLSGRFDGRVPRHSLLLHWRYYLDPPEFFTVMAGDSDGLHWGYWFDDPARTETACVASYYAHDAFEIAVEGDQLFEALRFHLESLQADTDLDAEYGHISAREAQKKCEDYARFRERLLTVATGERPETGDAYTDRYAGQATRNQAVVAETPEGMGIVVPAEKYQPLPVRYHSLVKQLRKGTDWRVIVESAREMLVPFPGTSLHVGKILWSCAGEEKQRAAGELLAAAYAALDRHPLRTVLLTHLACRELPQVDILADET